MKIGLVLECSSVDEWAAWLSEHHDSAAEVWLRFAKKGSSAVTVSRNDALELALCYGWIDGQAASQGEDYWLQRFTPRTRRSKWSKINCDTVERLIASGRMQPAGLAAVEAARRDGRWEAAYNSPSTIQTPPDLLDKLQKSPVAEAAFQRLDSRNRYAILYRIQDAKKPETRARRIEKFIGMLERGEKIY
jgi:uncharacterized protein YdeI (YjbR/CyaY-like superfamily)